MTAPLEISARSGLRWRSGLAQRSRISLEANERGKAFLESPAVQMAAKAIARTTERLAPGRTLGPYKIVSLLGSGGMGEVWRATDTALGRDVAIKVLPTAYCFDSERLRRFETEARAAGLLNHPNVLAVYTVGNENGFPYLVKSSRGRDTKAAVELRSCSISENG